MGCLGPMRFLLFVFIRKAFLGKERLFGDQQIIKSHVLGALFIHFIRDPGGGALASILIWGRRLTAFDLPLM